MPLARSTLRLLPVAATLSLLVASAPPADCLAALTGGRAPDPAEPVVALAALLGQALAAWLLLTATLTELSARRGRPGRLAAVVLARIAPACARRLVAIALGASLASAGGASALAAEPGPGTPASGWCLDWPARPEQAPAVPPAPQAPSSRQTPEFVTVRTGDSLWVIAARHLPPAAPAVAVAAAWPTWWAANRLVIGADPDLLLPGTRLTPPDRP